MRPVRVRWAGRPALPAGPRPWTELGDRAAAGSTGVYRTTVDVDPAALGGRRIELEVTDVGDLARVRVNGVDCGTVWTPPFRVDVSGLLQAKGNRLEVKVVNLWPNRMIGDETLGEAKRFTHSNMYKFTAASPLWVSGLLGPVRIVPEREAA